MEQPHHRPDAQGPGARLPDGRLPGHGHGRHRGRGRQCDHGPGHGRRRARSLSQEALRLREELVTHLACLPAVPGVLDAVLDALGTEQRGRDHRPLAPGRPARRPPRRRAPQRLGGQGRDRRLHVRQEAGAGVLRRRRHRAQLPRRPRARRTSSAGSTTWSSPAGAPTPPSRALVARTGPTRPLRRCSGR